jgi:hypothetical protein
VIEVNFKRIDNAAKVIRVRRTSQRGEIREHVLSRAGEACTVLLHDQHRLEVIEERTHGT